MLRFAVRRVIATVPVMALVALIVFSLLYLAPGDPALVIAGDQATAEQINQVRTNLGLNDPFWYRFWIWLWGVLHGDLGMSLISNVPVSTLISQRLEPTISLMVLTLLWSVLIGVPLSVFAAWKRGRAVDRFIMALSVLGFSVPVFVLGYCLSYIFAIQLRWFPIQGYAPLSRGIWPWLNSLALPAVALGSSYIALISRIGRASLVEILEQDYIRTAKAKGASAKSVLFSHALKNAAVPIVTVVGIGVGLLIGGAVVTETVFALPGLGRLTADSILRRDYPVIQGVVLLFSFTYVLINLVVDLVYPFFDPRIRY
ncbi:ABC transporter permease [Agrobacterium larrymoorei]|uniref:ABC transporter permease n=1 Tax=Agrobacterium larrymoorei TaxID=160699 RepID=A0AAF0HFS4_9HYPH|nr:ABC transporter permease [Agrobacterium larrymoorei]WHA43893.1 ABC transporter permease [Agrobacterium larrymoorei]